MSLLVRSTRDRGWEEEGWNRDDESDGLTDGANASFRCRNSSEQISRKSLLKLLVLVLALGCTSTAYFHAHFKISRRYSYVRDDAGKKFGVKQEASDWKPDCPQRLPGEDYLKLTKRRILEDRRAFFDLRKRLYVQHQFKCGGTFLCEYVKRLGYKVPTEHNCSGEPWMWPLINGTRQTLQSFLQKEDYRVLFNERAFFHTDAPTDDFIFITTARDPKFRVVSDMLQVWNGLEFDEKGIVRNLEVQLASFINHGEYKGIKSTLPRNPQVSTLAGVWRPESTDDMPSQYAHVLEQLKKFTFTIPTEELSMASEILDYFFGVKARLPVDSLERNYRGSTRQIKYLLENNPDLLRQIEMLDYYDLCLHQHVQALWDVQKRALSEIFGLK